MTDLTAGLPHDEPRITRHQADMMALRFLANSGPHTMGPIEDEYAMASMMIFLDLEKAGMVRRTVLSPGHLQFALTDKGRSVAAPITGE